jgi:plasmid stabilization system protein ParE
MGRYSRVESADEPIAFAVASRALKLRDPLGRKLKSLVLAREKKLRREIAIRLEGKTGKPVLRITIALLRREFPELFRPRDEASGQAMRRYVATIEDRIERISEATVSGYVDPRLASFRSKVLLELERIRSDIEIMAAELRETSSDLGALRIRHTAPNDEDQGIEGEGHE